MASSGNWATIHAERAALAADLDGLDETQWATSSLCTEWSVRDVLAHMTATALITPGSFVAKFVGSGFRMKSLQAKDLDVQLGPTSADTLANFEAVLTSTKHPPGPNDTWLGETLIHSEDIRRPLGITHHYPLDAAVRVADFYKGSNLVIGAKRRIAGLRLRATDIDWNHGDGPEVAGPMVSLVLAMTGRKPAISDLTGDGVAMLRTRD